MPRIDAAGNHRIVADGSRRRISNEGVGVLLIFEGDSISAGAGARTLAGPIWDRVRAQTQPRRVRRVAVGGSTVATADARASGVLALFSPGAVIAIGLGANDLVNEASATDFLTDFKAYTQQFVNAGFRVVVGTILSRTDGGANFDTVRADANDEITDSSNVGVYWHAVADVASDATMGVDQAPSVNSAYFTGTVHPNDAGYALLAPYWTAAIQSLIGSPVVNPLIHGGGR